MNHPNITKRDPYNLTGQKAVVYCRVSLDSSGEERSVKDQKRAAEQWAANAGVEIVSYHEDISLSASEFAKKPRPGYQATLLDIEAGKVDLVWFWALNRVTRKQQEYLDFQELCEKRGVRWVIDRRLVDPADMDDVFASDVDSLINKRFIRNLSKDLKRGKASRASRGVPAGRVPYGYRRRRSDVRPEGVSEEWLYRDGPQYVWQEPDYDGYPIENSPAYVVKEIYERVAAGHSLHSIRTSLESRGVLTPFAVTEGRMPEEEQRARYEKRQAEGRREPRWQLYSIRYIATSPTYIGLRVHGGWEKVPGKNPRWAGKRNVLEGVEAAWPPLVDESLYWTSRRILDDPVRNTWRPSRARSLLTNLARCGKCDGLLALHHTTKSNGLRQHVYECFQMACVGIVQDHLDDYVQENVIRWLGDPKQHAEIFSRVDDPEAAARALGEIERHRATLASTASLPRRIGSRLPSSPICRPTDRPRSTQRRSGSRACRSGPRSWPPPLQKTTRTRRLGGRDTTWRFNGRSSETSLRFG